MVLSAVSQLCRQLLDHLHRKSARRSPRGRHPDRPLVVESLEGRTLLNGTWTTFTSPHAPPEVIGTMLLLSDGTVMAQGASRAANRNRWYRLKPDDTGNYLSGTWSSLASMSIQRLYYGSAVLPDGRVFVLGGEYSGPGDLHNDVNTGEIYDPVANSWSPIPNFPQAQFGDNSAEVLPDGRVLVGYLSGPLTYIFDPATNGWSLPISRQHSDRNSEESWVKLPDDSILSYDIWASPSLPGHSQRYVPSLGQWVDAGSVPVALSSAAAGNELGPAVLLPDGRAFFIGATGHTAYYTPATNTWAAGPDVPNHLGADDAPAAVLPNGKVLLSVDPVTPPFYHGPITLFEFDPASGIYTDVTPPTSVINTTGGAYASSMLLLPTGQVLMTTYTNKLALYTPDTGPLDDAKPAIASITPNADGSFTLAGTQLNGLNEGAAYGDDSQMASNYPIVRLTDASGRVYFARTFNWSSTGVATGDTQVTTQFTLPADLPAGDYSVVAIANGVASDPVAYTFGETVATHFGVVPSGDTVTAGTPFTVTVTALDANDNPVTGYQGRVHFRSNDAQGLLPAHYTFTADDQGVHTFTVTLETAGTRHLTVRDIADHSVKGRATVLVVPAPAVALQLSAPAGVAPGTAFDVTVVAVDPYGNVDTNYQGTITWASTDGDPGVVLPADYTFQPSDQGQVTFAGGVTLITSGDQVLSAIDVDRGITGSATVSVLPG